MFWLYNNQQLFRLFFITLISLQTTFSLNKIQKPESYSVFAKMARTKTTSRVCSQSPPTAADDQPSDHSPLNETPFHTILQDVIIPVHDTPKSSKPKSSKPNYFTCRYGV